jgi:hypothetical protein
MKGGVTASQSGRRAKLKDEDNVKRLVQAALDRNIEIEVIGKHALNLMSHDR